MKPYYRISLKQDDNTWYAISGKAVSKQTTPFYFFKKCISGWKDIGIEDQRNLRMWGFFRNYTEDSYDFVLQAATIVRSVWLTKGNNAPLILYVEKLNRTTQEYEFDYQSNINLNTASSKRDKISAKVLEAGIEALIKSREDTTYLINIDNYGAKHVSLQPFRVLGKARWLTGWPIRGAGGTASFSTNAPFYKPYIIAIDKTLVPVSNTYANNEPISFPDASLNNNISGQDWDEGTGVGTGWSSGAQFNYLFKANIDLKNVKLTGTIAFYVANNSGQNNKYRIMLAKLDNAGNIVTGNYFNFSESPVINNGTSLNFSLDINSTPFDMAANERLILVGILLSTVGGSHTHNIAWEKDNKIEVQFEHYTDSFTVRGLPWWKVGEILISKVTNNKATFKSDLFKTQTLWQNNYDLNPADMTMLCGDSIRGIAGALLKISLKDYLKASFVMCGAGLGVEGTDVRIEHMSRFLKYNAPNDGDLIADLGEVADCEITPATDFTGYNGIQIGYPVQTYDDVNGKDEFNNTSEYLLPMTTDKNMFDAVSPVRADGLGIFYTWAKYSLYENKDSSSDNDLFVIQSRNNPDPATGVYPALYPNNLTPMPTITGVLDPTRIVNFGLTPARCLRRLGSFIASWFYGQDADKLIYQYGDKNMNLVSKVTMASPIQENADIQLSSLGDRLFLPFYLYPSTQGTNNYTQLWQAKRDGFFRFNYLGITYNGFPIKSSAKNAVPKLLDWQLLATPANNPVDWIR